VDANAERRIFRISLSISVVLHGLLLLVVIQQNQWITDKNTLADTTLDVSLRFSPPDEFVQNPQPETTVEAENFNSVAQALPQQKSAPEIVDTAVRDNDQGKDPARGVEPVEPKLKQSVSSMIKGSVEQTGIELSRAPGCTLPQRASEVRVCDPEESEINRRVSIAAYEGTFSDAFRRLSPKSPDFHRDMAMVASLMERHEELENLEPSEGLEFALIAQEQRDIREAILRIDRRYQQVNLFKLIPVGAKVVKGLWEAAKRKS